MPPSVHVRPYPLVRLAVRLAVRPSARSRPPSLGSQRSDMRRCLRMPVPFNCNGAAPTRSSLQSGRLPVHVNVLNLAPDAWYASVCAYLCSAKANYTLSIIPPVRASLDMLVTHWHRGRFGHCGGAGTRRIQYPGSRCVQSPFYQRIWSFALMCSQPLPAHHASAIAAADSPHRSFFIRLLSVSSDEHFK